MIILGLTGSIAMGKSTVAEMFSNKGIPVISADKIVHDLYEGKAVPLIETAFPGSTHENKVDRQKLMQSLLKQNEGFEKLEAIIHPLVRQEEWRFIQQQKTTGSETIIIEIPLLFETGAEALMDAVILVSAPAEIQKQRALARPGMSEEKFTSLVEKQMPDATKRERADYIIETHTSLEETQTAVNSLIETVKKQIKPKAYQKWAELNL